MGLVGAASDKRKKGGKASFLYDRLRASEEDGKTEKANIEGGEIEGRKKSGLLTERR